MRLWRSLRPRILLAAVACGLVGLVGSAWVATESTVSSLATRLGPAFEKLLETEVGQCAAASGLWRLDFAGGASMFAYDAKSNASANPDAPPLDTTLLARLKAGEVSPGRLYWGESRGGSLLIRGTPAGPCAFIQVVWPRDMRLRLDKYAVLLLVSALAIGCTAAIGSAVVIRPLLSRIAALDRSTSSIGRRAPLTVESARGRDELGRVAERLEEAHRRILADAQALERHLVDVAHDLRTPLTALELNLAELHDSYKDERLVAALCQAEDVIQLLEDLRVAAQLREGFDPTDGSAELGGIVERLAARYRTLARRRGIALEVSRPDAPIVVSCRENMALQAIANLVQNAVAYCDPGGHVAVVLESEGDTFSISVLDDGPGVPVAELQKLTERSYRGDEAIRRDPGGSGLGLAITRRICDECGFQLTFAHEQPRGLRVEISGRSRGVARGDRGCRTVNGH